MQILCKNMESKFVKVKCAKCKNTQVIFGKASTKVKCLECNGILSEPSGGKAKIRARVEEVL
ncbi:MAG: 30S ribosomal protein S27e [Nanoarchaeota archaeon]